MPSSPEARYLHATRQLATDLHGPELVQRVKETNEELVGAVKADDMQLAQKVGEIYSDWVVEWVGRVEEENLVGPLIPTKIRTEY